MKKCIAIILSIMFILTLTACANSSNNVSKYLYSSSGKYIAFYHEGFLYDKSSHERIAKYDKDKKVFYSNNGYYGEIYNKCYLLYNQNSEYIDYQFGYMPIAPIAPIQPIITNIDSIQLPTGFRDCAIQISKSDLSEYGITLESNCSGYAAYYVYFKNVIKYDKTKYEIIDDIEINFTLSVTYRGYLKSDYTYSQSKTFSTIQSMSATTSRDKIESIYNLQHKDYGFYEVLSSSITISSVKGAIVQK